MENLRPTFTLIFQIPIGAMMKASFFKPNTLAGQINLRVTGFVFLCLFILGLSLLQFLNVSYENSINRDLQSLLNFAKRGFSEPQFSFNQSAINAIGHSIVTENKDTVVSVRLLDREGKEQFNEVSSELSKETRRTSLEKKEFVVGQDTVTYEDSEIGSVEIVFSRKKYDREFWLWAVGICLYTLLITSMFATVNHFGLRRLLSNPLQHLLSGLLRLKKKDYLTTLSGDFKYELKIISQVYNLAVEEIHLRDQQLVGYAASLAEKVEERTRERDLQRANAVNSARLAALGEMSAGVAHEINNPLAIIDMNADKITKLLNQRNVVIDADLNKPIQKIHDMVTRIAKIIKGLRSFARNGSQDSMTPFSIPKFIDDVKDLCQTRIAKSDVKLEFINKVPNEISATGREVQVSQVLINLINNAMDAIEKLPEKWIRVEVELINHFIVFSVTDSGSGIPPEIRDKLMQPFFTTKEIGKGTGLGLSISLGIIREHGGDFQYNDKCPHTQFIFTIPSASAQQGVSHEEAG